MRRVELLLAATILTVALLIIAVVPNHNTNLTKPAGADKTTAGERELKSRSFYDMHNDRT